MVRVLFMTYPWALQMPGGGERVLLNSRAELLRRGYGVDLFDPWKHKLRDYDVVHYFHCPGWEAWERIKAFGGRLVVTPTLWWDPPVRGWLSRQFRHSLHRLVDPWWVPPIDERDARAHLMIPDLLLPASEAEAARLERHLGIPRSKMGVVRNAVTIDESGALPPDLAEALGNKGVLLCVGSFHRVKNQLGLIHALRRTEFRVVFIGSRYPEDTEDYLETCRREAGAKHWFFPQQPRGVVLQAMRRTKVYVQPSLRETCGLAALEAAALGCRVAITERGATTEYFSRFASYCNPEDESSIRRAIETACETDYAEDLATLIRSEYTWKRVGDQLESAYKEIISS
jgi:glycosyltransferase involved in cell wall biosynthesis